MMEIKIDNKKGTRMDLADFIPAIIITNEAPMINSFNVQV